MERPEKAEPAALAERRRRLARDLDAPVCETELWEQAEIEQESATDAEKLRERIHPLNRLFELEKVVAVHRINACVHLASRHAVASKTADG